MKLSIIIPMYNCCDNVVKTLEKLGHQAIDLCCAEAMQVIVVNDESTEDASLVEETCRLLGFDYYWQQNAGGAAACNAGLSHVNGEYFTFIDADDSITDCYLATTMGELDGRYDLIAHRWIDQNGVVGDWHEPPLINWNVWANVYRTSLFAGTKFDEDIIVAWDIDWLRRAITADKAKEILRSDNITNIYDSSYSESTTNKFNRGEIKIRKSDS